MKTPKTEIRSTTILAIRHKGKVVVAGDGQVTMNETVVKGSAQKVRRMAGGKVLAGFAGSAGTSPCIAASKRPCALAAAGSATNRVRTR